MDVAVQMRLMFLAGLIVLVTVIALIAWLTNLVSRDLAERPGGPAGADGRPHDPAEGSAQHLGHHIEIGQARWRLLL
jgi:hypothetical protein